jgi:hypothetical protein
MVTRRKRTKIPCILCKNTIRFPEYVGQDYSGDLLCGTCASLLHIKLKGWEVKQYKVLRDRSELWKDSKKLNFLQETMAKLKYGPEKSKKVGGE